MKFNLKSIENRYRIRNVNITILTIWKGNSFFLFNSKLAPILFENYIIIFNFEEKFYKSTFRYNCKINEVYIHTLNLSNDIK